MSPVMPGFGYDILIRYRQKENKYNCGVTEFNGYLKRELEATFKDYFSIYFDESPSHRSLETYLFYKCLENKFGRVVKRVSVNKCRRIKHLLCFTRILKSSE